jgi:hypothetical protein
MPDADALARLRQFVSEGAPPPPVAAGIDLMVATAPPTAAVVAAALPAAPTAAAAAAAAAAAVAAAAAAVAPFSSSGVPDFSAWPNEAIPLISPVLGADGNEHLTVNPAALALLRRVPVAVAVMAVSGLYRTGKSSLLNWLVDPTVNAAYDLNAASTAVVDEAGSDEQAASTAATAAAAAVALASPGAGFAVGATVQRCTRGIWLWGRPRAVSLRDGSVGALLILDTEGLGGLESEGQYDARIFALATLLCSTLAYNSLGTIDEKAIGSLSFIAQLSRNIKVTGEDGSGSGGDDDGRKGGRERNADVDLQKFFPEFCWIVRDFALELVTEDGEPMSADEYLESALKPQSGFDASTVERNAIRRAVTSYFSSRRTVTLVYVDGDLAIFKGIGTQLEWRVACSLLDLAFCFVWILFSL